MSQKIGGLCGKFNLYDQDDHTDRTGMIVSTAYFPEEPNLDYVFSWLVSMTSALLIFRVWLFYFPNNILDNIFLRGTVVKV